jgi:hypothetical protein
MWYNLRHDDPDYDADEYGDRPRNTSATSSWKVRSKASRVTSSEVCQMTINGNMKTFLAAVTVLASATAADAQGMYMPNGRAMPSVIVGPGGEVPVDPGPNFAGPSPIAPVVPPPAYAPPPPPPGEVCVVDPADVGNAPFLNVRASPNGWPVGLLPNGAPVVLGQQYAGDWVLIAAPIPGWVFRPLLACQPPVSQPTDAYAYQPPERGLRSAPPPPIPGAPFEREPD